MVKNTLARNNSIAVFLMGALPAVAGSTISFLLSAFFVWGVISILLGRFECRLTQGDRLLAWAFSAFAILTFLTAVIADHPIQGLVEFISYLPFFSLWVIIPRLRASPGIDYVALYSAGAGAGAVGAMIFGLLEIGVYGLRPEGGSGNAAIFAMMSLSLAAVASLNSTSPSPALRRLAIIGTVAGLVAMTASLTRGVWIATPVLFLLFVYLQRNRLRIPSTFTLAATTLTIVAGTVLAGGQISARLEAIVSDYEAISQGQVSSSTGHRLQLWEGGFKAFQESPLWGHGLQNRMEAVAAHLPAGGPGYTHVHNGFLNFAIDGGLLLLTAVIAMLAAPVIVASGAPAGPHYSGRLFLATSITATYGVCGMTQIMFNHDIMDSFFIFTGIVVAASTPQTHSDADELLLSR